MYLQESVHTRIRRGIHGTTQLAQQPADSIVGVATGRLPDGILTPSAQLLLDEKLSQK